VRRVVDKIIDVVKIRNPGLDKNKLSEITADLLRNRYFRRQFAFRLGMKPPTLRSNTVYNESGSSATITVTNSGLVYRSSEGAVENFSRAGILLERRPRAGR